MTSFPVENVGESKHPLVWLKILSWRITCNSQICIIFFLLASGITGLRPCFQFSNLKKSTKTDSNWTTKSCFILSRVRRIRWASHFFPTEKFERSSKLKLKATITLPFNSQYICIFIILNFVSSLAMTFTCYTILFVTKFERITPTWYEKFIVTNIRISFHQCLHLILDFSRFLFWANIFYLPPVVGFKLKLSIQFRSLHILKRIIN